VNDRDPVDAPQAVSVAGELVVFLGVPGLPTPRIYDFLATDTTGFATGVEVKTTLYGAIFLDPNQVNKDVAVANGGGIAVTTGQVVEGVAYHAYCFNCYPILLDIQSATLYLRLLFAGIPVTYGPRLERQ
jgi:hypothetical protein